jgi:hypothetical protein
MPSDLPIACSLDSTELSERLTEISAIGRAALIDVETRPARAILRFTPSTSTRRRLDAIVAAESRCCAFLRLDLHEASDAIVLTIDAPTDAALVVDELVCAFSDQEVRA